MREVIDPYKGKTYSQVMESLSSEDRKKYAVTPHPKLNVPGTGRATWDASIERWVV